MLEKGQVSFPEDRGTCDISQIVPATIAVVYEDPTRSGGTHIPQLRSVIWGPGKGTVGSQSLETGTVQANLGNKFPT